jgi:hexokinase
MRESPSREQVKAELMERLSQRLDEVMASPTVTMSDIENVVMAFQKDLGREVTARLLALKKTPQTQG